MNYERMISDDYKDEINNQINDLLLLYNITLSSLINATKDVNDNKMSMMINEAAIKAYNAQNKTHDIGIIGTFNLFQIQKYINKQTKLKKSVKNAFDNNLHHLKHYYQSNKRFLTKVIRTYRNSLTILSNIMNINIANTLIDIIDILDSAPESLFNKGIQYLYID